MLLQISFLKFSSKSDKSTESRDDRGTAWWVPELGVGDEGTDFPS